MIDDQDQLDHRLLPDDFDRRAIIRNRGTLFPENGRRRTVSFPTPLENRGDIQNVPQIVVTEGGVFAFDVILVDPLGSSTTDVAAVQVGNPAGAYFNVYFDPSNELYVTVFAPSPSRSAQITVPFARCGLSHTRPVRIAAGIRIHDPNRFLCVWADGRLVAVTGKGSFPSLPSSWAPDTNLSVENNTGIRIVSPQVAYYRGAPEPRGANR